MAFFDTVTDDRVRTGAGGRCGAVAFAGAGEGAFEMNEGGPGAPARRR